MVVTVLWAGARLSSRGGEASDDGLTRSRRGSSPKAFSRVRGSAMWRRGMTSRPIIYRIGVGMSAIAASFAASADFSAAISPLRASVAA